MRHLLVTQELAENVARVAVDAAFATLGGLRTVWE
jgi:hypothetical protein